MFYLCKWSRGIQKPGCRLEVGRDTDHVSSGLGDSKWRNRIFGDQRTLTSLSLSSLILTLLQTGALMSSVSPILLFDEMCVIKVKVGRKWLWKGPRQSTFRKDPRIPPRRLKRNFIGRGPNLPFYWGRGDTVNNEEVGESLKIFKYL